MGKSLSERIAARMHTKQPSRGGKNRASFLALREDVRKALDDGWPVKVIWDTLSNEGKIGFGYDAFLGYVNHLIRNTKTEKGENITTPADQKKSKTTPNISGFTFDATPQKEDLI